MCTSRPQRGHCLLFLLPFILSSCFATAAHNLRGQDNDRLLNTGSDTNVNIVDITDTVLTCEDDMSLSIVCPGDCNFTARNAYGTCESKMFQYHGGPCPSASVSVFKTSDTAANCWDVKTHINTQGQDVFVVITDAADPSKNSSMWTQAGGYFWTSYQDYPVGALGLSDTQNITFYSTNTTLSHKTMIQTMLFHAPCHGTPLELLDRHQPVQLIGTAVDPQLRAYLEVHLQTKANPNHQWQLSSLAITSSSTPAYQQLAPTNALLAATPDTGNASWPLVFEVHRNDTLAVLGTATFLTPTGLECAISTLYSSDTSDITKNGLSVTKSRSWP